MHTYPRRVVVYLHYDMTRGPNTLLRLGPDYYFLLDPGYIYMETTITGPVLDQTTTPV